jgi:hypothetical protein
VELGGDLAPVSRSDSLDHWLETDDEKAKASLRWGAATPAVMDDLDLKHLVLPITS